MTAGILSRLGIDMGNIKSPDTQNPTGYFEDKDLLSLIDNIFETVGPQFNGFNPPSLDKILLQQANFSKNIKMLIEKRCSRTKSQLWGWKAPSMSFVLPLFLPYLVNPFLVLVTRNPLAIANSMVRYTRYKNNLYNELSLIEALKLTNLYYDQIYTFIEDHPYLPMSFVCYEAILNDPRRSIKTLANDLSLKLSVGTLRKARMHVNSRASIRARRIMFEMQTHGRRSLLPFIFKSIKNPQKIPQKIRNFLSDL